MGPTREFDIAALIIVVAVGAFYAGWWSRGRWDSEK
jgi:hypothetical protein